MRRRQAATEPSLPPVEVLDQLAYGSPGDISRWARAHDFNGVALIKVLANHRAVREGRPPEHERVGRLYFPHSRRSL